MSLLSHNDLNVTLLPEHVSLVSTRNRLTLHGVEKKITARTEIKATPGGDTLWSGAVSELSTALLDFQRNDMRANIVLSNYFVNYAIVPWCEGLSDADEIPYAQHCFRDMYGNAADGWEVRVSPNSTGAPALASAVDARLLEELRGVMERMHVSIRSIQPHMMAAFNCCQRALQGRDAWFALLEPGNLCLAAMRKGQFFRVRKMRIGSAWREELFRILERENYLACSEDVGEDVFLWAPQYEEADISVDMPSGSKWDIQYLKPDSKYGRELVRHTLHKVE